MGESVCVLCKYESKLDFTQALNCAQDERLQRRVRNQRPRFFLEAEGQVEEELEPGPEGHFQP